MAATDPGSGLETIDCPICGAGDARPWAVEYKGGSIVRCRVCGFRFVNPRKKREAAQAIYEDGYFTAARRAEGDADARGPMVEQNKGFVRRILSFAAEKDPRVLDVGTGTGFILKVFKMMGHHRVEGTDLTRANREELARHGIPLHTGAIEDLKIGPYDVVTAHHVIEHVPDLDGFLRGIRGVLAENGVLHLLLPNEGGLTSRLKSWSGRLGLGRRPFKHLSPGHHLYFFEIRTLKRLLGKHGFRVLHLATCSRLRPFSPVSRLVHAFLTAIGVNAWIEVAARVTGPDSSA
jgi:2-polyprenyl-3-methyl-5-hydroxy-6-metoxy-1,4-benzoquinol methylase